jgi:hypothetical protein
MKPRVWPQLRSRWLFLLFFVLLVITASRANTVSVGCAGSSGTFDFTSVNDAVNFLSSLGKHDHAIVISGTCTETVVLDDWDNLLLVGNTGAGIFAPASPGSNIGIIEILHSKRISVSGLDLRGTGTSGPSPMFVLDSSVNIFQCTLENGGVLAGGGMFVQGHSNVGLSGTTVQNNSPNGIRVDGPATVQVGSVDTTLEPTPSVIQGSPVGLEARGSGLVGVSGNSIIQNNGVGVRVSGGQAVFCCGDGQRQVLNNQVGVALETGGKLETIGPVLMQGNAAFGVRILGGRATIGDGNTIQQNGAGVLVRASSSLNLSGGAVVNNSGPGITVRDGSSAIITGESVSGNADGVRVLILSSAAVSGPNTIVGNTGTDLACTPDSLGYGDKTAVGTLHCPNFGVDPLPGP